MPTVLPVVRPTKLFQNLENHFVLDMRAANVTGDKLAELIVDSVEATQLPIVQNLPDMITLSHKQFISVETNTEAMDATEDRVYVTPYNAMEVTIDKNYQTVDEDLLDIVIGYEADDIGMTRQEAKGVIDERL